VSFEGDDIRSFDTATGDVGWTAPLPATGLHPTGVDDKGVSHYVTESGMQN
jgi:hypothetical protein